MKNLKNAPHSGIQILRYLIDSINQNREEKDVYEGIPKGVVGRRLDLLKTTLDKTPNTSLIVEEKMLFDGAMSKDLQIRETFQPQSIECCKKSRHLALDHGMDI